MPDSWKKLLAAMLALLLLVGLLPMTFATQEEQDAPALTELVPDPQEQGGSEPTAPLDKARVKLDALTPHMNGEVYIPQTDEELRPAGENLYIPKRDLPSSFDSRDSNLITAVKNQAYGDCWAHAAMACCETYMIKNQVPVAANGVIGSPADLSLNLSENHHAWFTYTHAYDALGMINNDYTTFGNNLFQFGGSGDLSMYSLMRWQGPANEATSALAYYRSYDNTNSPTTSSIDAQYAYSADAGHVMSVIKIPTSNRNAVKQAIMEYGAGDFTYYSSDTAAADNTNGTYFCNQDSVVNTTSYHNIDHAVTLVGWDDNFSKYNFTTTPSGNGAWIVKNSWGTSYGQSGYYYISYYDTASYNSNTYFYAVEPIDNYDNNYQYDGTTNFSNTRYVSSGSSFAQAFTANGAETLEAVALAAPANFSYTLKIYTGGDLDVADPTTGATLVTQQSGTLTYAGYQKIALENPVNLTAGQRFIVLFTNTSTGSKDMPVDMVGTYSYGYGWNISWTHTAHANSSYRCNSSWSNESASFNFRIKAYTTNERFNLTALSDDTAQGTVQVSGTRILVSPATGYGIDRVEVVTGSASYTISGNTISVSATADCTLKVFFKRLDQYTVTFIANNKVMTMTAYGGVPITLPTPEDEEILDANNENYYAMFYGWVPERCANADDEPAEIYDAGDGYTASGDVTLYGLYWVEETTPSTEVKTYSLVSSADEVVEGNYVITWDNMYYLPSETAATSSPTVGTGISVTNGALDMEVTSNMIWSFDGSNSSGFTVSHTNGGTTYYLSSANSSTGLKVVTNSSGVSTWKASVNNTYGMLLKGSDGGTRYAAVYNNSSWRYYSIGSSYTGKLRLYQETVTGDPGVSVEYFTTDFPGTCTHSWGDWAVTTAATCSTGGVETRTCTLCGATETRDTAALPHSWAPGETVEPTCTAQGYTNYTCSRCGETKQDDLIEALGHDWIAGESTEPTCTEPGTASATCRLCGITDTVETAPALGHDWGDWTVTQEASCLAAGSRTHTCSRCQTSENETIPALGHDFGAWYTVTAATADNPGAQRRDCSRCDAFETNVLPALGHDYRVLFIVPCGETAPAAMISNTNTGITLPTMGSYTYNNVEYSFVGWVPATVADTTSDPTAAVLTSPYTAPGDVTLYALYSYTVSSGSSAQSGYKLTTDAPAKDDKIILTRLVDGDYYAMTNAATPSYSKLTLSGNYVSSPADSVIWDVGKATSGVYLYPTGNTGNSLHMNSSALKVASGTTNGDIVFSLNSDGESFKGTRSDDARWIVTNGTYGFTCSATEANAAKLYIFKYVSGSTPTQTTHWTTEISAHTAAAAVEENRVEATCLTEGSYDSVVYCSVCDAELSRTQETIRKLTETVQQTEVHGQSLTVESTVIANVYLIIPDDLTENNSELEVRIYNGDKLLSSQPVEDADLTADGYRFPLTVPAKNVKDTVTLKLCDGNSDLVMLNGGSPVSTVQYSVQGYLDNVIANENGVYSEALVNLCKAMSDYGVFAMTQQHYNTGNLSMVNFTGDINGSNAISVETSGLAGQADLVSVPDQSAIAGLRFYGASLVMDGEMAIRFYFQYTGSANLTCNGKALTPNGGYLYAEITKIAAKDFDEGQTVTISDGTNTFTVSGYSVHTYIRQQLQKVADGKPVDEDLVRLVRAIANYGFKAEIYFS